MPVGWRGKSNKAPSVPPKLFGIFGERGGFNLPWKTVPLNDMVYKPVSGSQI